MKRKNSANNMSKRAVSKLTHTWEKKDCPLSVTTKLLDEDRIISGILLENNKADDVRKKRLKDQVDDLSNDVALLEATLKLKREELKKVEDERTLFLKDEKKKERRVSFIHCLMSKRELIVAQQKMGEQPLAMTKEEEDWNRCLVKRLENLQVDDTPDLQLLDEWERIRHSDKVRQILKEQEDADWKAWEEEAQAHFEYDMEIEGGGDVVYDTSVIDEEDEKDTSPIYSVDISFPPLSEDPDTISTEKFVMFQPVRIVKGKHSAIKAYFVDYDTPNVVFVMLNKDPLQRERVFRSSITATRCSTDGCNTYATAPLNCYPYKFDTPLCKEHQL